MAKPNVITKEELLEAAQQCLADKGIDKTTLKAVAERANVSQGTVFYHFRTKEQLMFELVQSLCDASWKSLQKDDKTIEVALHNAKERCDYHSTYHRLFYSSLAVSLQTQANRLQMGSMIQKENEYLTEILTSRWGESPLIEVSMDHWGIMINALIDGLAVQALLDEEFPKEDIFKSLQLLLEFITKDVDK
ncbi:hypothetical protein JCM10914A_47340 [Paenibacillus sp. JCM 10914]|uniref:TetR/AcrR family transcriptional regulator n=1 Tax=Paenibacillus sp. JCM 10914 TaxID=1236974 RepID=UPI0003CC9138|nr:TetR/AcrR family transcriptional regulator [Paenibacillus sp. JCM 10914]GAE08074.1 transcriptional regulator, TetR family [Paenibacillus sp. JCM 10914]